MCKTLMPDVMVPEPHLRTITAMCWTQWTYFQLITQKFSIVGGYTEELKKPQLSKLGGGCFIGAGRLIGTIMVTEV